MLHVERYTWRFNRPLKSPITRIVPRKQAYQGHEIRVVIFDVVHEFLIVTVRSHGLICFFQDFQQNLQTQLAEYNFIFSLGTTIKMKASEDSKARIEDQLNSISSLKKSLFDEIEAHLQSLNSKSKQWEGFQEQMDKFVEYMDKVDSRLERSRRESRVSQEWLAQVKVTALQGYQSERPDNGIRSFSSQTIIP